MGEPRTIFKLSEPGSTVVQDPAMGEYLRCYEFPQPPDVRYGYYRFDSPQKNDRVQLFGQAWLPDHAIGTVLLLHGYSEHSANFAQLVKNFTDAKFAVMAMDLRGHGLSEGPKGHVENPFTYTEDVEEFTENTFRQLLPHRPLYIWGHSLGSLVGLQILKRGNLSVRPSAAVFSSALLGFPELSGPQKILAALAPVIAKILPTFPVKHNIPDEVLSHDEAYLSRRFEDPLIGKVATPKWLIAMKKAVGDMQKSPEQFQKLSSTLFLLAGDEKVTNLNDARKFAFKAYAGMKHKVIEFPGYYHELEKELGIRDRVVSESIAWFKSHH